MCACVRGAANAGRDRSDADAHVTSLDPSVQSSLVALVIAADPNIESLLGELVAFAGHLPVFDPTVGAAGEAVRRERADVVLIDNALGDALTTACIDAADEVGTAPVLVSSTLDERELQGDARRRGCAYFALPGRPQTLATLIERLTSNRHGLPAIEEVPSVPGRSPMAKAKPTVHPAICAAMVSIEHARVVAGRARTAVIETRALRVEMHETLAEARRQRAALRAALSDYVSELRAKDVSRDQALELVRETLVSCATAVGAQDSLAYLLDETRHWTLDAWAAA